MNLTAIVREAHSRDDMLSVVGLTSISFFIILLLPCSAIFQFHPTLPQVHLYRDAIIMAASLRAVAVFAVFFISFLFLFFHPYLVDGLV